MKTVVIGGAYALTQSRRARQRSRTDNPPSAASVNDLKDQNLRSPPKTLVDSKMTSVPQSDDSRAALLSLLRSKSVFHGDFILSSGARSNYYIDCRLTTLDPGGAWLVGKSMHALIRKEQAARNAPVVAVGGLTMGADPIALATGMVSHAAKDPSPLRVFVVRKAPKAHGQTRLIEGNFQKGDTVVVVDDVITRGDSTLAAIHAVEQEGGTVAFVAVLVDRQEGGRERIEATGHPVFSLFTKGELLADVHR